MNSIGLSLIAFIFVLGVLIFIHEFGHYLVAKLLGIRVDVFSLGFGKRLSGFKKGDTDYRISLIPLGGYVKMAGENPDEELTGSQEEFLSRPKRQRLAVAVAGPAMNIGLALLVVALSFVVGKQVAAYVSEAAVIGSIEAGSPAERVGLRVHDKIVSIDGETVPTWRDVEFKIATSPDLLLTLEVEREGHNLRREVVVEAAGDVGTGSIGIRPFVPYLIGGVQPDSPAQRAGLQQGDKIVAVRTADVKYSGFFSIAKVISGSKGQPLVFKVVRKGERLEKTITPALVEGKPRIGAFLQYETRTEQFGLFRSFQKSAEENYRLAVLTFETVGRIITGRASMKQMSGPIEIARYSGIAASMGWMSLLSFMALVSLQLGLLNLLPIPVLDGGVIALLAVEGLLRKDLSLRAKERISQAGFIFLILLMGVVIFNDLAKNIPIF
ncbi:MAG: RIP metalloprotease RseP [Acidobacteriota bacterium]